MTSVDSPPLRQLIKTARVCGLSEQPALPTQTRAIIKRADQAKRLLSRDELSLICQASGIGVETLHQLQADADNLVAQVCVELKGERPDLFQPGGALHSNERADACWRDCWNFLRVLLYAFAAGQSQFTDPQGMEALRELYLRMAVPMGAMRTALLRLRERFMEATSNSDEQALVGACFDHLLDNLNNSAVKS